MESININIFSLNANGLGDDTKRHAVFSKLKQKGKGVFLLQETHSCTMNASRFEKSWGNKNIIFSHGKSNSKGAAILFSDGFDFKVIKQYTDSEGRFVIIDIKHNNHTFTIANLYAPTRDKESEQISIFKQFINTLQTFNQENVIIGGDFNLYLSQKLDKMDTTSLSNDNPNYRKEIESYLDSENMFDIWRVLNPDKRMFTWHRGDKKSRLDYFFISDHLTNILKDTSILPGIHSDHSLLKLSLSNATNHNIGKGMWKFNSSLLHDTEYVTNVKNILSIAKSKYNYINDKRAVWELIKMDIRSFTVPYTVKKKKEQQALEIQLNKRYEHLHSKVLSNSANDLEEEEFISIKHEI